MKSVHFALSILLVATSLVAFSPTAAADTCASKFAEDVVCTPVNVAYCALNPKYFGICAQPVIDHCMEACWDDLPVTFGEIDLTFLYACPGGSFEEERTTVGPITVVTLRCTGGT